MPRKRTKMYWLRIFVQIFFLLLIALISFNHYRVELNLSPILVGSPSLHAVCPFGGVVTAYTYFTQGTYIKKIHESSFTLMWLILILTLFFGPVFCGWICPLGTVQEFIGKIGQKLLGKRYNHLLPPKADYWLRYIRYGMFFLVVIMTIRELTLVFLNIDPYFALFNFWSDEITITSLIMLVAVLIGSLFIERAWCKYLCPLGALLGVFNLFRIIQLKRNEKTCINCKQCDRVCPMNIDISNKKVVRNHQCISCLICTDEITCPVKNTLGFSFLKPKSKEDIPLKGGI